MRRSALCLSKPLFARRTFPFSTTAATITNISPPPPPAPPPPQVTIVEVGPRDGLQNEASPIISTKQKVELITRLAHAGLPVIEVGSFVSPKWVPAMADSALVLKELHQWKQQQQQQPNNKLTPPIFSVLVPNLKGLEQAMQYEYQYQYEYSQQVVDEVAIFASASEAFSQKNLNCSISESIERFRAVAEKVVATSNQHSNSNSNSNSHLLRLRGYVSCVVACPYQGSVEPSHVARVTELMLELGCHEISLGDTIGVGTPGSINAMLDEVMVRTSVHYVCS
jgi:hydroxymethylglutaryl-CoA lyase